MESLLVKEPKLQVVKRSLLRLETLQDVCQVDLCYFLTYYDKSKAGNLQVCGWIIFITHNANRFIIHFPPTELQKYASLLSCRAETTNHTHSISPHQTIDFISVLLGGFPLFRNFLKFSDFAKLSIISSYIKLESSNVRAHSGNSVTPWPCI